VGVGEGVRVGADVGVGTLTTMRTDRATLIDPSVLQARSVYAVVLRGVTTVQSWGSRTGSTAPIIESSARPALITVQHSCDRWPGRIRDGEAPNETMKGGPGAGVPGR